jgi:uncharacterized protein (UPF0548 family)
MPVQLLGSDEAARLRTAALTYDRASVRGPGTPPGFRRIEGSRQLQRRDFDGAAQDLLAWRMHETAGLRVHASDPTVRTDSVVVLRLGVGPVSMRIPCRVLEVIDEPRRRGFVYGTLPGHPESGEERFVLDHEPDGTLRFTVTACSRHATLLARAGGPVGRAIQDWMTRRYLGALD